MGIGNHPELLKKTYDLMPSFKCLGDEIRLQILALLSDEGELTVNQIVDRIDLSRPAVSHHLMLLKQAGFISFRKEGNLRYHKIKFLDFLNDLESWVIGFKAECKHLE